MKKILFVFIFSFSFVFGQSWPQINKVVPNLRATEDFFGRSVSIDGDYAIIGADYEDEDANENNTLSSAGAAYIFKNIAGTWTFSQKIVASDRRAYDAFGSSVAISGDYAIVAAAGQDYDANNLNLQYSAGAAYIFYRNSSTGVWSQIHKIVPSDRAEYDNFGKSVSISGEYAVVGAYYEDENAVNGETLEGAGSAYIFKNNVGTWSQVQKIVASDRTISDRFGCSVSISGDYIVVGASDEDHGEPSLAGVGAAYVFKNVSGTWGEVKKITSTDGSADDLFGNSVAISGDYVIVGAYAEDEDASGSNTKSLSGSAYIFTNNLDTWTETQKIVASDRAVNDYFGFSVGISGNYAIVGAFSEDENATGGGTLDLAGSAYVFKNNSGTWSEQQKIVASDRASGDQFGSSVAISGSNLIVGAVYQDKDAAGLNILVSAGASYIFNNPEVLPVDLTSFSANINENRIILNWQTATEVNNYGFQVERKMEKSESEWEVVGFVEGHGNSNSPKDYTFTDDLLNLSLGLNLNYRLKQVDFDGNYKYSNVVEVKLAENVKAYKLEQNYPNPFNPSTVIKYSIPTDVRGEIQEVRVTVYDILGNEVATLVNENKSAGNYEVKFNASNLVSGIYLYKLQSGSFIQTRKLMLLK